MTRVRRHANPLFLLSAVRGRSCSVWDFSAATSERSADEADVRVSLSEFDA